MAHRGGRVVAACLVLVVASLFLVCGPAASVRAASPTPAIVPGGDTRSEGEGAGFVGSPFFVALAVVALGLGTAAATTLVVRLARDDA